MDLRQELPYRADYAYYGDEDHESYCNGCHGVIEEDNLRLGVEGHISFRSRNPPILWHHFSCFFDRFRPLIQEIAHFAQLKYNDQKRIKRAIKRSLLQSFSELSDLSTDDNQSQDSDHINGETPKKKRKKNKNKMSPEEKALKRQSDLFYKNLRFLETIEFEDVIQLMDYNKIDIPTKLTSKWDRLADAMTFGRLVRCPQCKRGQLVFRICGYICCGYAQQVDKKRKWFRCDYQTTETPERKAFKVPKELTQKYDFLKQYKYERRDRLYIPSLVRASERMIQIDSSGDSFDD